jgi:hypothetical protein
VSRIANVAEVFLFVCIVSSMLAVSGCSPTAAQIATYESKVKALYPGGCNCSDMCNGNPFGAASQYGCKETNNGGTVVVNGVTIDVPCLCSCQTGVFSSSKSCVWDESVLADKAKDYKLPEEHDM